MSWILDIIVVAIIGLTVFFSVKNGFVKTAISAASFLICLLVTVIFVSPLSEALKTTSMAESIKETTESNINNFITDEKLGGIHDLAEGKSEGFNTLLRIAGIEQSEIKAWYNENVQSESSDTADKLAAKISEPIVSLLASLLAVVILFLGTKLLLAAVSFILNQFAKLPVLHSCNKLLGVVLGVLLSVVRVCLFCFVVRLLVEHASFIGNGFISDLDPQKTLLFRLFYEFDMFAFLKSLFLIRPIK